MIVGLGSRLMSKLTYTVASCICPSSRNSHLQNRLGLGQESLLLVFPLDVHVAGWNGDRAQSSLGLLCAQQLTPSLLQMEVQETGLGAESLTGTSMAVLKDAGIFFACWGALHIGLSLSDIKQNLLLKKKKKQLGLEK